MKFQTRLVLFTLVLAACAPSSASHAVVTPGTYEYQDFAYEIAWSADDSMVALTTLTGLYLYDTKTHEQLFAFEQGSGWGATFSEKHLAVLGHDGLTVWDLNGFRQLFHVDPEQPIQFQSVAIDPQEKLLVTAELDQLRIWRLPDGKALAIIPQAGPQADMVLKDGSHLILAEPQSGVIQEWDLQASKKTGQVDIGRPVVRFNLSADGEVVIVDYGNNGFELWNLKTGRLEHAYTDIIGAPGWTNLSGDHRSVVAWGYPLNAGESGLSVWDLWSHTQLFELATPLVNGDGWRNAALNSDGSILAAGNNEGYIYFYDMKTGKKTGEIFLPYKYIVEKG